MGDQPWNRSAGKFDVPTSSIPNPRGAPPNGRDKALYERERSERIAGRRAITILVDDFADPPERYHGVEPVKAAPRGKRIR